MISSKRREAELSETLTSLAEVPPITTSAFGDPVSVALTPLFQTDFGQGVLNSRLFSVTTNGGGSSASVANSILSAVSGPGPGTSTTVRGPYVKYRPGFSLFARFTTLFPDHATDTGSAFVGAATDDDGILVGVDAGAFTIIHRRGGVDTAITNFSGDSNFVAAFDPAVGNIWQINLPYLGFGSIDILLQSNNSEFQLFHRIARPNRSSSTSFASPTFRFSLETEGEATASTASCLLGIHGPDRVSRQLLWADSAAYSAPNGTSYPYALRNASAGGIMRLSELSIGFESTKIATLNLYVGTASGGVFAPVDADSVAESASPAAAPSPGYLVYSVALAKDADLVIKLREFSLDLEPGDDLICELVTTATADVAISAVWWDDV